jgi:hypothetical protein
LEYSVSELEGKVEELQSKIVVCQNSKLKIQEGVGGEKRGVDYINRLQNFKCRKLLEYCWIQKSTRPSHGVLSSKRGKFQMIVAQWNMRYISITCTTTNDVGVV